ncbi:hypothetical protein JWG45_03470 [Leptospira sp. 201903070]|uniref:Uncharacterized protein n=1 Tax=Leptospira ainlahdjerensis TaxID=2810033 RepID=A0ABS2U763_9LEPT|nr:hypothetical protein [Leptospira ainlahdjerensis]MBM9576205.1 hypothetical protein [Leptospira ainlahdjerensis]
MFLPTSCLDLQKNMSELRRPSVKVARPALILGGGEGGGKIPETFLYHKIKFFARKNSHVGIPTKHLSSGHFLSYLLSTLGLGYGASSHAFKIFF